MASETTLFQVRSEMRRRGGLTVWQQYPVKLHDRIRIASYQGIKGQARCDWLERPARATRPNEKVKIELAVSVTAIQL